jgi:pyruvate/2-oxoglutarate dehydrogenase complex dihydrolipoamide dehydrogenase (E3) component
MVDKPEGDRPGTIRFLRWPFAEVPAALAAGEREGFVKLAVDPRGRIRGATVVGRGAAELIVPWCAAVAGGLKVQEIAELPVPALSLSEGSRRAASTFYLPATTNPSVRRLIGFLRRFG